MFVSVPSRHRLTRVGRRGEDDENECNEAHELGSNLLLVSELERVQFSSSVDFHMAPFGETVTIWQRWGYDHHQRSCKADRRVEGANIPSRLKPSARRLPSGVAMKRHIVSSSLIRLFATILFCLVATEAAQAEPCRYRSFEGASYIVCSFDPTKEDLRIFWRGNDGKPYRTFAALAADLEAKGKSLQFAMNGGMYQGDLRPVGLYIENGRELTAANTATITGAPSQIPNFYKKPNGVFYIAYHEAGVLETGRFLAEKPKANFATQSGPMLVIDGAIHPAFLPKSTDRKPRNGVGVSSPTEVFFVITKGWVSFYEFARFFRDGLGCSNALFLDGGEAPGLYAPALGRNDAPGHGGYGPIIAVVE